jgi:hypothetical protein
VKKNKELVQVAILTPPRREKEVQKTVASFSSSPGFEKLKWQEESLRLKRSIRHYRG